MRWVLSFTAAQVTRGQGSPAPLKLIRTWSSPVFPHGLEVIEGLVALTGIEPESSRPMWSDRVVTN